MPGGVSSPVRAFQAVGGDPVVIAYGSGPHIFDADGRRYIDYVCAYGPLILGHAPPRVARVVAAAAQRGTAYGATSELEIELAGLIAEAVPSMELVRFVNAGTEATMSALRLARAATGRDAIVKFEGGYHGHADGLLVRAGSGATTLSLPDSSGVPKAYAAETLLAPYNDIEAVKALFEAEGERIAAVIVEPIAANMGVVPPAPGFLEGLREVTTQYGALLIFDEVITGFRLHYGAVQTLLNVTPDITCLGKIIGGGLPVAAYGGRRDIMEQVAPLGPVYQAGTLSGNPLAMAAGIVTLEQLRPEVVYQRLEITAVYLEDTLRRAAQAAEVPVRLNRAGSIMTLFFTNEDVTDYATALKADRDRYAAYFRGMLNRGVFLAPSQFEAMFVSTTHGDDEVVATGEAAEATLRDLHPE
ncbi:MAG: glutamate-1-semialdehyde-2,1-aminomutase [Chloroflexi bacterium]|nr:MAG: glutamate-1-semialdehyde-2,1-aminomutase [Chloroflexota bacterium]